MKESISICYRQRPTIGVLNHHELRPLSGSRPGRNCLPPILQRSSLSRSPRPTSPTKGSGCSAMRALQIAAYHNVSRRCMREGSDIVEHSDTSGRERVTNKRIMVCKHQSQVLQRRGRRNTAKPLNSCQGTCVIMALLILMLRVKGNLVNN